jgi:hypothetical protein
MPTSSVTTLIQLLDIQRERLAVYREFQASTNDPYFKSALSFVIEDTQEAIARAASRLRQLGQRTADHSPGTIPDLNVSDGQAHEELAYRLLFVWHALKDQLDWYNARIKTLLDDADTQAILVALAEQNRVRLERWDNLLDEMKVSRNS